MASRAFGIGRRKGAEDGMLPRTTDQGPTIDEDQHADPEEMSRRIARFGDLKPYSPRLCRIDRRAGRRSTQLTAHRVYTIMVPTDYEGRSRNADQRACAAASSTLGMPPDNGQPARPRADRGELFCLSSRFGIIWGDEAASGDAQAARFLGAAGRRPPLPTTSAARIDAPPVIIQPASEEQRIASPMRRPSPRR